MPSPSLKCRNSAISSTVATLEKPHFIGRFSAYSLMEKLRGRYEWRRERSWVRTFSAGTIVDELPQRKLTSPAGIRHGASDLKRRAPQRGIVVQMQINPGGGARMITTL
jgi:hypothetical protein